MLEVRSKQYRAVDQGMNISKRHTKPTSTGQHGRIVERQATIHLLYVMQIDPKTHKPTRVGSRMLDVARQVQDPRGPGDRLQGDTAQDADVRVPRPAGDDRAAAGARLPRHSGVEGLRRPR